MRFALNTNGYFSELKAHFSLKIRTTDHSNDLAFYFSKALSDKFPQKKELLSIIQLVCDCSSMSYDLHITILAKDTQKRRHIIHN